MCLECDGFSYEQVMLALDLRIRTYGWSLALVDDEVPWSYTIGLTESYGHPELMMIGLEPDRQRSVVAELADMVARTGATDTAALRKEGLRLVEVHVDKLHDHWFGTWSNRYGTLPEPGSFLQIVPPPTWFCSCHRNSLPRFDDPGVWKPGTRDARRRRR